MKNVAATTFAVSLERAFWLGLLVFFLFSQFAWSNELTQTPGGFITEKPALSQNTAEAPVSSATAFPQAELSQDFLMQDSPLSKPTAEDTTELTVVAISGAGKECTSSGNSEIGSQSCLERKEDGQFAESKLEWENFGNESKRQIVTENYFSDGSVSGKETIRLKTLFRTTEGGNILKQKDFFDIVKQPAQGLITRELIIKEYGKDGEVSKITWAHYREIGDKKAGLAHHAVLYYQNGQLSSGFANQYKNGKVSDILLNYDPVRNPNLRLEQTGATKWANWIDQLVHRTPVSIA